MHDSTLTAEIPDEPRHYDDVQYLRKRITELELRCARLDYNWKSGKPYPYKQAPTVVKYESCCMQPRLKLPSLKKEQCATCGARFDLTNPVSIQHQRG